MCVYFRAKRARTSFESAAHEQANGRSAARTSTPGREGLGQEVEEEMGEGMGEGRGGSLLGEEEEGGHEDGHDEEVGSSVGEADAEHGVDGHGKISACFCLGLCL